MVIPFQLVDPGSRFTSNFTSVSYIDAWLDTARADLLAVPDVSPLSSFEWMILLLVVGCLVLAKHSHT